MNLALLIAMSLATAPADSGQPQTAPVPPSEAAARLSLPEGFTATLFAGEPDVVQPIAFTIDPKGRLWVVECLSYPDWSRDGTGNDRILIFEDTDGDGRFDRRTVFWDKGSNLSGIEVGFGGVWVCSTPNLLFIPDRDGDDVPDGEPEVVLDGWNLDAQHNVFNGLTWGPDGWLYGCNGILSQSRIGKPGTPDEQRVPIDCGVWRYHPTRQVFEAVAHGTTNPWGLDFDDHGEMFITNCVIPHLFHVVPGGHYQRMFGQDLRPNIYELLSSCADHVHWDTAEKWSDIRETGVTATTDQAGGGHAHAGAMIYLGDNWPTSYRDTLLTCNVHGNRVNHDRLRREGSSYIASHEPDFLLANDDWFRGLELKYGPDGAVYVTDWSDTGECHEHDEDGAHRDNGRILKVSFGTPEPVKKVDLASQSHEELVAYQLHPNDWYVRTARRLLQERNLSGNERDSAKQALWEILTTHSGETRRLRALWALNAIDALSEDDFLELFDAESATVRAWSIRLLGDQPALGDSNLQRLKRLATEDPSPRVRLALASLLQRLPLEDRWSIVEPLAARAEDADDPMIPLMVWYGAEPLAADSDRAIDLSTRAEIPTVRRLLARRVIDADVGSGLRAVLASMAKSDDPARQRDWLDGALEALRGVRSIERPEGWDAAIAQIQGLNDPDLQERADRLALKFGDAEAIASIKATLMDPKADKARRERAVAALVDQRQPGTVGVLQELVKQGDLLGSAIPALAAFEDETSTRLLLECYPKLPQQARDDALATLSARPGSANALLEAIGSGQVPRRDLSVTLARQIQAFEDKALTNRLGAVWGTTRPTSKEKSALMAQYKAFLTPETLRQADPVQGRAVYERTCLQCHKLHGEGGDVGPELTGSDRANLDYILENVLDPSATVGGDYKMVVVATEDGRLLTGIIREQNESSITLQTANERVVIPREEIEAFRTSDESMMPEGLFEKLTEEEIRDLVSYLAIQQPLPE